MKIAVAGTGYVGLSLATLLSQNNEVVALDVIKEKVDMINNRISPIKAEYIEDYFTNKKLNLKATLDYEEAFSILGCDGNGCGFVCRTAGQHLLLDPGPRPLWRRQG